MIPNNKPRVRRPKGIFAATAAWLNDPSDLPPIASAQAKSSTFPRRANLYNKSASEVKNKLPPASCAADTPDSIKFLCDFVKRPRDLRRWQPGYQVTPRTANTRSPRTSFGNFVNLPFPVDIVRFRRPKKEGEWDGLVRRQKQQPNEDGSAPLDHKDTPQVIPSEGIRTVVKENDTEGKEKLEAQKKSDAEKTARKQAEAAAAKFQHDKEVGRMGVFKRLQIDGEIALDKLMEALRLLNFPRPNDNWVNELVPTISRYATLSSAEFLNFIALYDEKQWRAYEDEFHRYDEDNSGQMDVQELANLLKGFGVTPLPGILEENIAELDFDGSGQINLQEFTKVLELQWEREGFAKSEVEEFQKAFKKFDRDRSGEVSADELMGIVSWLGYPQRGEVVKNIIKRADSDGTGALGWTEMLSCMRWLREAEVHRVHELLRKYDQDGSGEVDYMELLPLLAELGYTATTEAIQNAVEDAKLGSDDNAFDFNELWRLLHVFRRRSGFTRIEDAELIAAHSRYDHKKTGFLDTLHLGKALRLLGYSVPIVTQQRLLEQVDVDASGKLDLAEFRTLMRMQREFELEEMKRIFYEYATNFKMNPADLARALRKAGCSMGPDGLIRQSELSMVTPHSGPLEFDDFWQIVSSNFKASRDRMRQSAGFTPAEVADFRKLFQEFDNDGTGDIAGAELRKLISNIFPNLNKSIADRRLMEEILNDVDRDGSGSLDFADFLRLMRHYHDEHDRTQLENMFEGFTDDEAKQFRYIFDAEDTRKSGHLTHQMVLVMVQRICPLGAENLQVLHKLLSEVRGNSSMIDFQSFLRVMRHLIDVDLGGINSHAAMRASAIEEEPRKAK